jgi:hypothetical protein
MTLVVGDDFDASTALNTDEMCSKCGQEGEK